MKHLLYYIVYKTTNLVNDKIYVGVHSTDNPDVFDGYLGSGKVLLLAKKKYGKEKFKRETLFTYETYEEAFLKEHRIVDKEFIERKDTYNIKIGGDGFAGGKDHPMFGKHHTEETKKKMSGKNHHNYGKPHSEETKKKIGLGNKGKCFSKKHKKKLSDSHKGKYLTEETRKKLSIAHKGRHHTNEVKEKISMALRNDKHYNFGKCGNETPRFGMVHSEETKRKIGESNMLRFNIVEQRRHDVQLIKQLWGWKTKLSKKWKVSVSNTIQFINKYASDLVRLDA